MSFIAPSGSIAPNAAYPLMAACLLTVASMPNLTWSPSVSTVGLASGGHKTRMGHPRRGSADRRASKGVVVAESTIGQLPEQLPGVRHEGDLSIGEHGGELGQRRPATLGHLLRLVSHGAVPDCLVGVLEAASGVVLVEMRSERG